MLAYPIKAVASTQITRLIGTNTGTSTTQAYQRVVPNDQAIRHTAKLPHSKLLHVLHTLFNTAQSLMSQNKQHKTPGDQCINTATQPTHSLLPFWPVRHCQLLEDRFHGNSSERTSPVRNHIALTHRATCKHKGSQSTLQMRMQLWLRLINIQQLQ